MKYNVNTRNYRIGGTIGSEYECLIYMVNNLLRKRNKKLLERTVQKNHNQRNRILVQDDSRFEIEH